MAARRGAPGIHSLAALLALSLAGCAPSFPPIADGPGGDAAFKVRIATTYRPGSSGAALGADLAAQGFMIQADLPARRFSALDTPGNLPCWSRTRVDWTEDRRGRIVEVQAGRNACT